MQSVSFQKDVMPVGLLRRASILEIVCLCTLTTLFSFTVNRNLNNQLGYRARNPVTVVPPSECHQAQPIATSCVLKYRVFRVGHFDAKLLVEGMVCHKPFSVFPQLDRMAVHVALI